MPARHFTVVSDHHALKWLLLIKDPSGKLECWSLKLQQYDFTVRYKPGEQHRNADALLRLDGSTAAINLPNKGCDEICIFQKKEPKLVDPIKYLDCGIPPADKKDHENFLKI